ncbi:MAG: long-chain fatty acid--CoA ligase [Acidobacteria bacterium]|nr:MAG: long-chain fatty acid--CoA ligase [Acidobacteriota bacterium]
MKNTMMDFQLTLAPMLERAGTLYPTVQIVSRMPDRSLYRCTYADLVTRVRTLARALIAAGLQRGERVATLMWNHSVHLETYFGVPLAGGVIHTLNLRLPAQQLALIANHAGDRFLVVDEILLPAFQRFISDAPFERVFVHRTGSGPFDRYEDYEALLKTAPDDCALPQLNEYDAAAMCYTSGTTGDPKGVVYSHRALVLHSMALAMADSLAFSHNDSVMPVVPMFHANAWGFPYVATMVGAKQVLPGPYLDAESLLDLCQREQVTLATGVPTVWMAVCAELDKNPRHWRVAPGLRLAVGGSAPAESLIRRFDAHNIRLIHAWGMTESTPIASICRLRPSLGEMSEDEQYALRSTQGTPVPFMEARVISRTGPVPWDGKTMGEVQLRGPWVASSYFNMPELGDKWTPDGWLRTGDVVTVNEHGYLHIVDRTKDLIKSGGEWISSVDLENAIVGYAGVKEAAVIAVPHPKWDERPIAVIVAGEPKPKPEELNDFLAKRFAKWQLPDAYIFVEELPHTSTGKLLKSALRDRYRDYLNGHFSIAD